MWPRMRRWLPWVGYGLFGTLLAVGGTLDALHVIWTGVR